ncbi:MAG: hypothetical protein ACLFST_07455 [Spirochaetia bacterium]
MRLSIWAITMMAFEGTAILPLEREPHIDPLPDRMIALWPYTKMNDPRVFWGGKYIFVRQDVRNDDRFKIGVSNRPGWVGYLRNNIIFLKKLPSRYLCRLSEF